MLTISLFYFSFYAALSGTSPYESFVYTLFNFALGLPIIALGIMDEEFPDHYLLSNPILFKEGLENKRLNVNAIGRWVLNSILYAILLCIFSYTVSFPSLLTYSLFSMGQSVFVGMVNSLHLKVIFLLNSFSHPILLSFLISIPGLYLLLYLYNLSEFYLGVSDFVFDHGAVFFLFFSFSLPISLLLLIDLVGYSISLLSPTSSPHLDHKIAAKSTTKSTTENPVS